MSGGKGGSQTQTTQQTIPDYLKEPIKRNIARAEDISKIGFVPYMGPEVAALTPMQEASMQSTGMAAEAFGLPNALGSQVTPEPQTFAGGVQGYSSFPLYEQAIAELQASRPGQYDAIMNQFIDPFTGQPAPVAEPEQNSNQFTRDMYNQFKEMDRIEQRKINARQGR
jgi:hypothetical protein